MLKLKAHGLDAILQLYIQYQLHYFQGDFYSSKASSKITPNQKQKQLDGAVSVNYNDEIKW